jgi:hypothetical protein
MSWRSVIAVMVICALLVLWIATGGTEFWK